MKPDIKFAITLLFGIADADAILRRLTRRNVEGASYRALCELMREASKTTFPFDCLHLGAFRRGIHESLQVIESWNSANDSILYDKCREFAGNELDEQELLVLLSLHLLQVSAVYVITQMIQIVSAIRTSDAPGEDVDALKK